MPQNIFGRYVDRKVIKSPSIKNLPMSQVRTIQKVSVGRAEDGHKHAWTINTFHVAAASGNGYETQDIKNLSLLMTTNKGSRNFYRSFTARIQVSYNGYTAGAIYPVMVYPFLLKLASGGSIATTETAIGYSLEDALLNAVTGDCTYVPCSQVNPQIKQIVWNGSQYQFFFLADTKVDLTEAVNHFCNSLQNSPIITDPSLHLVIAIATPDSHDVDITVKTCLEQDAEIVKTKF